MTNVSKVPTEQALIAAMQAAWNDHHHARDQTWKALQMEAVLGAGLVTVDAQFGQPLATVAAAALVLLAAFLGTMITLRHRELERRKFIHIMNCEEELGLHRDDLIPLRREALVELGIEPPATDPSEGKRRPQAEIIQASAVRVPPKINVLDIARLWTANNTSLFILRMHIGIALFALLIALARVASWFT